MSSLRKGILLGLGNPLLDISANTDEDFLKKYDLKANNAILAEEKHQSMYQEMIVNYDVEYTAGGACQNTMRIAQWVLNTPEICSFMGCIGKDSFGKTLEKKAREAGVNVSYQYSSETPTGTCAVVLTGNGTNRSLCANLAAANCFEVDHIRKPENRQLIENAEFFYITGFFLTVSPETILEVAKHACKNNKTFIMNLSAPFLSQFFKEPMTQALPYVDILFGNETEAQTFATEQNFNTTDVKEIALRICDLPKLNNEKPRFVVITQGELPVILACDNKITEFPVKSLSPEELVDSNGAGDAFVGGFLAQLIQGKPIATCIKCGIYTAQEVIMQSGCTVSGVCKFRE
ncbi:uncharacterized protein Adk2 [Centruroides vittatus]|uniref:uncharacterized protein Adk2 n=1 Tax=Centruroides vittatus TaxID=120091 RepID=UPI0035105248